MDEALNQYKERMENELFGIPKCVLCDKKATQTATQIPVCDDHRKEYEAEAKQYLAYRPFYLKLQTAYQRYGVFIKP